MRYYINDDCVNCRMCLTECPAGAIYYGVDKYEIDPDKCVSCGRCERCCGQGAVVDADAPAEAAPVDPKAEYSCDLLVIGAGGGMVAAARASVLDPSQTILVAEKKKKIGGCAWNAIGLNISGSEFQKQAGIGFDLDEKVAEAMRMTKCRLDERLVRNMFSVSGPFFDWLCSMGDVEKNFRVNTQRTRFGVGGVDFFNRRPDENRGAGRFVVEKMKKVCDANGVEILTSCAVTGAERDEEGLRFTAELSGRPIAIRARAAIIASGSWIANKEILEKYVPAFAGVKQFRSAHNSRYATGDGLTLARQLGARIDYGTMCARFGGPCPPVFEVNIGAFIGKPECVNINAEGRRWGSEEPFILPGMDPEQAGDPPVLKQPGAFTWCVMDSCILKKIADDNMANPNGEGFDRLGPDYLEKLELQAARGSNIIRRADTIEGLAEAIGVDPAVLRSEIDAYNADCHAGKDTRFGKKPEHMLPIEQAPFYASLGATMSDGAFGGIPIDPEMRVYVGDAPAEDLFAIGDITSGRLINDGGQKRQIINDLTWAVLSGYMAAENAVKYLS